MKKPKAEAKPQPSIEEKSDRLATALEAYEMIDRIDEDLERVLDGGNLSQTDVEFIVSLSSARLQLKRFAEVDIWTL